jgi:hypothetical protein
MKLRKRKLNDLYRKFENILHFISKLRILKKNVTLNKKIPNTHPIYNTWIELFTSLF